MTEDAKSIRKHGRDHDAPYPIETLSEQDGYVLVYCDPKAHNPGGSPVVLARKVPYGIEPMFSEGRFMGARWWRPVPAL